MFSLSEFAKAELERAGWFSEDSDYAGFVGVAVIELIQIFSRQGHSGLSANIVTGIFTKPAKFEPITPLTGEDEEWFEYNDGQFQNKRCSHVFKRGKDGHAYDSEGKVFREPSGACFTSIDSRVFVTFPYTPKTEIVDVSRRSEGG